MVQMAVKVGPMVVWHQVSYKPLLPETVFILFADILYYQALMS